MPSHVAILRAYQRPEFLAYVLKCLHTARTPQNFAVIGCVDNHAGTARNDDVIDMLRVREFPFHMAAQHSNEGDTHFMFCALRHALNAGAYWIYNLEEDVLFGQDFFRWHEEAKSFGANLTVASNHLQDPRVSEDADPTAAFESTRPCAVGCCFTRELALKLLEHNTPDYYRSFESMKNYLSREFPRYPSKDDVQWDGLLRRIFWRDGLTAIYPLKPRAYHAGWYGANRGQGNPFASLSLSEQIAKVGEIIYDNEKLQEASGHAADCRVFNLEDRWLRLHLT